MSDLREQIGNYKTVVGFPLGALVLTPDLDGLVVHLLSSFLVIGYENCDDCDGTGDADTLDGLVEGGCSSCGGSGRQWPEWAQDAISRVDYYDDEWTADSMLDALFAAQGQEDK